MSQIIRVLIVDDHELVRMGLSVLLEDIEWVRIAGQASNASEAIQLVEQHQPDLIIMDIRMPGQSGIEACAEITRRWPATKVIMLTSHGDDDLIVSALQAGATGYVLKQIGNQSLLNALEAVRNGGALLDPIVTQQLINRVLQREQERQAHAFSDLSEREIQVLALIAQAKSNTAIAEELHLSPKTVRNYVSIIMTKLNVTNRIEAAAYASRHAIDKYEF